MRNLEIAAVFRDIAKILEIKGENVFRIRAYERAAQNIESLTEDIERMVREERLTEIPGIGKDLSQRIVEYVTTGSIPLYTDLKKTIPEGLLELLKIPSVGPKTARLLFDKLKIKSIVDLEQAIEKGRLAGLFGIKEKTIQNIRHGIELLKKGKERMTLAQAVQLGGEFYRALIKIPEVKEIAVAGSLRRRKETVRDIDILAVSGKPVKVMDIFAGLPAVAEVISKGDTKASVRTRDGLQVDCRVVERRSFGAALLYFTGSKNFNIKVRQLAIKKGLKINEYGVFRKGKCIAGRSEPEIFKLLKMQYIEPELREDTGEIELALSSKVPPLVGLEDIKGDFHVHSQWSDGNNSIQEIAGAARTRGYSYIAVTDHSQGLRIAHGVRIADLKKKKKEIDRINSGLKDFRVLFGTEVDIGSDGSLDYPAKVLAGFDIVIAAIHSGFKQSKEQMTRRLVRACQNRHVHIIAHPTGRLWGVRDPYDIDLAEVFTAARDSNTSMEINAFPQRFDLNDINSRRAKERGVKIAIDTDAHSIDQLAVMGLGVAVARRGWLSKDDVLNTLPLDTLLRTIKK